MTLIGRLLLPIAIGGTVFWIAFDGGTYGLESRATLSIAAWWTILVAVVLGIWPLAQPPRAALLPGGFLAALAVLTAASIGWAESAERAFTEFNRVALFLAVFLVAVLAGTRGNAGRWADGIAFGVTATGLLALASRLFLDVLPAGDIPDFLPASVTRLSYPVEYWNGLAILIGLAFPLLLRIATESHGLVWRGLAVAAFPALAATIYLTSSRGGVGVASVGLVSFLVLTPRRWPAVAAAALAAAGSAASIAVLLARDALVNQPFEAPEAVGQGRSAALLILVACAVVGLVYAAGVRWAGTAIRVPSLAGRVAAGVAVLAALVGVAASDPVDRFETFKAPPEEVPIEETDFVRAHLLSGNGSGRWQFWDAALEAFADHPVLGMGAGSYESWWAERGSIAMFVRDAHSLYLETLAELGVVGLVLVAGFFGVGLVAGVRRFLASAGDERLLMAALLSSFVSYLVAVGVDWSWELTVVSIVGVLLLGFLTGPATAAALRPRLARDRAEPSPRRRFAVGVGAVVAGWLLICAQAIPFLADVKISDSQAAVTRGDGEQALEDADAARALQPWAASPYLQLALVHETVGDFPRAREAIREAIDRDPRDWRLWLVASRVATKAGDIEAARRNLERAAELNPRSPLFASVR
jgi:O-Antigen ligase/Tetratricopeptide repeat